MTSKRANDLRQELARSQEIRGRPGLTRSDDPREFGRRVARETFESYVNSRDGIEDTEKR